MPKCKGILFINALQNGRLCYLLNAIKMGGGKTLTFIVLRSDVKNTKHAYLTFKDII